MKTVGQSLSHTQRVHIVDECQRNVAAHGAPRVRAVARKLGHTRRVVQRWWDRRHLPEATAEKNRGRPVHKSFATDTAIDAAVAECEDLEPGEHASEAAAKLCCTTRTLYNHTHSLMNWLYPPRQHVRADTPVTRQKRKDFADGALTKNTDPKRRRLKKKFKNATWLDHKIVTEFGLNRSHQRQARR